MANRQKAGNDRSSAFERVLGVTVNLIGLLFLPWPAAVLLTLFVASCVFFLTRSPGFSAALLAAGLILIAVMAIVRDEPDADEVVPVGVLDDRLSLIYEALERIEQGIPKPNDAVRPVATTPVSTPASTPTATRLTPSAADVAAKQAELRPIILAYINATMRGSAPLLSLESDHSGAQLWAEELATRKEMVHAKPDSLVEPALKTVAEVIGSGDDWHEVVTALADSPENRTALADQRLTTAKIGIGVDSGERVYVVIRLYDRG